MWEERLSVVRIDDKGRVILPKQLREGKKAVVISAGTFAVVIPVLSPPEERATSWLVAKRSRKELKDAAETSARKDAVDRARRHRQL